MQATPQEAGGRLFIYSARAEQPELTTGATFAARREDGGELPLVATSRTGPAAGAIDAVETLLIAAAVPPGRYLGLKIDRPDLDSALIDQPFVVGRGTTTTLVVRSDEEGRFRLAAPERLPSGLHGYATVPDADLLFQFDKRSGRVAAIEAVGRTPRGLALDERRRRLYVALAGEDALISIDTLSGETVERLELDGGDAPEELALSPSGELLVVVNAGSDSVSLVDPRSFVETARLAVGKQPQSVLIDATGRRAFVFNTESDQLTVIDLRRAAVARVVETEAGPWRGRFDRRERTLYVVHRGSPFLSVFDSESLALLRRVYVGADARALQVDPRSDRIQLARRGTGTIEVFDPLSWLPVDAWPVPGEVDFLAIDSESYTLLAALPHRHQIHVMSLGARTTPWSIDLPGEPGYVVIAGQEGAIR